MKNTDKVQTEATNVLVKHLIVTQDREHQDVVLNRNSQLCAECLKCIQTPQTGDSSDFTSWACWSGIN